MACPVPDSLTSVETRVPEQRELRLRPLPLPLVAVSGTIRRYPSTRASAPPATTQMEVRDSKFDTSYFECFGRLTGLYDITA